MNIKRPLHLVALSTLLVLLGVVGSASSALAQAALRPGDTVNLRLGGVPSEDSSQFSAVYSIDSRGFLNLPYIGEIRAAGLLPADVQRSIESKLKLDKIYTNPTVTLNTDSQQVFVAVGGAVKSPGRIPYTADMTLMIAINAAGGFNDFANEKKIDLRRGDAVQRYDARDLRKNPGRDPKILPGDQVDVGESFF